MSTKKILRMKIKELIKKEELLYKVVDDITKNYKECMKEKRAQLNEVKKERFRYKNKLDSVLISELRKDGVMPPKMVKRGKI